MQLQLVDVCSHTARNNNKQTVSVMDRTAVVVGKMDEIHFEFNCKSIEAITFCKVNCLIILPFGKRLR